VTVRADAHDGHLRLGIEVQTGDQLVAGIAASLTLPPGQVPGPGWS